LEELAARIAPLANTDATAARQGLAADPAGFALTARAAALADMDVRSQKAGLAELPGQRRVLVIVDQCEQIFTQCEAEEERRAFITALHRSWPWWSRIATCSLR
jgi:hypothetical protein